METGQLPAGDQRLPSTPALLGVHDGRGPCPEAPSQQRPLGKASAGGRRARSLHHERCWAGEDAASRPPGPFKGRGVLGLEGRVPRRPSTGSSCSDRSASSESAFGERGLRCWRQKGLCRCSEASFSRPGLDDAPPLAGILVRSVLWLAVPSGVPSPLCLLVLVSGGGEEGHAGGGPAPSLGRLEKLPLNHHHCLH